MTDAPNDDSQLWMLKPRFHARVQEDILWHADNRAGSNDFS